MSKSQSQSRPPKRAAIDFFKPYDRSVTSKRLSPTPEDHHGQDRFSKKPKKVPKTPSTATRFVNISSSPPKSPFAYGFSPKLPYRSPRPNEQGTPSSLRSNVFLSTEHKQQSPVKANTPFSFADLPTTGQSVVKDGKVIAVRDSDEDDSESLESLEDIFSRHKGDNTSSVSPPEENKKDTQKHTVLGVFSNRERQSIVGKDRLREILAKDRQHKFNISKLIEDHLDDTETAAKLSTANAYYEASAKQADLDSRKPQDDQKLLADVIDGKGGDHDEVARVLGAMERTGALASEQSFSFFGSKGLTDWEVEPPPKHKLPSDDVPWGLWDHVDTDGLNRAYREGAIGDSAKHGELPESLVRWTFESIAIEHNDDLREAYVQCLVDASSHWTRTNLDAQDVQNVFETLGADANVIRDGAHVVPNRRKTLSQRRREPKYLLSVLEVFDGIANDLDFTALSKLSSILVRLSLDSEAMSNGDISTATDDLFSKLLELPNHLSRFHVAERILTDMGENLKDSSLQARLLQRIQATSPLAARLRILLAETFLLRTESQSKDFSEPPRVSLPALLQYLRSPTFDLAHRPNDNPVNYIEISALAQILDIAISAGGLPSSFPSRAAEIAFNRQVDDLADRVNVIFSSIADAGASHMRRTEAKEAVGVLHKRLLYEVRTKPRPKKSVFGGRDGKEDRGEEKSRGAMQNFLKKKTVLQEKEAQALQNSQESETETLIRKQLELSQ